jgi:hypothetical protein
MGGFNSAWFVSVAIALVLVVIATRDLPINVCRLFFTLATLFFVIGAVGLANNFHTIYELRWPWSARSRRSLPVVANTELKLQFSGGRDVPTGERLDNINNWYTVYSPSIQITARNQKGAEIGGAATPTIWTIFVFLSIRRAFNN